MKTIGIVGGLGTETSCSFCFNVNGQVKRVSRVQPNLIMDNVPISDQLVHQLATGGQPRLVLELLKDSVNRLNKVNCEFIAIPCNTVHVFIKELRALSKVPILSIIEETVSSCVKKSLKTVGVLGSTTTIKSRLYQQELNQHSIKIITPNSKEQEIVAGIIMKIINLESNDQDKNKLLEIIQNMKDNGAEAVILGCTDLFLLVKKNEGSLPVIDSTKVLEEAVVNKILLA